MAVADSEDGVVASEDVGEALVEEAVALVDAVVASAGVAVAGDVEVLVGVDVDVAVSEVIKVSYFLFFMRYFHVPLPSG